jgi:hypothetical protein
MVGYDTYQVATDDLRPESLDRNYVFTSTFTLGYLDVGRSNTLSHHPLHQRDGSRYLEVALARV